MRNLRHVNVDHLHVGWYQSTFYGSFLNKMLLDSQFTYQSQIEESVALIYDPTKTAKDQLSLRAFRLSRAMMANLKANGDFSTEKWVGFVNNRHCLVDQSCWWAFSTSAVTAPAYEFV